ncbi:MAG: quinoprotein dehydrogenase-associated putative ABC transporter substrate-binding protein [Hyphomicrobium sp.]
MKFISLSALLGSATALLLCAASSAEAVERKEYDLSTPYEQLTPAEIAATKQAAKRRKISTLSVCADPGNMPLSDNAQEGYQNKIIEAVAEQLGARVSYFWRPYLERGLTRETFANDECDILLDMPADSSSVLTTIPIYRSTYVFAYLSDRHYDFKGLDDPRLKELKIGTYQHSAIRIVLANLGIKNLTSLAIITPDADLRPENQPWRQVEKVVDGQLDVVGVWGPFAGWVKKVKGAPITVQPVNVLEDNVPLEFSLAIGVQNTDVVLKFALDYALMAKKDEIGKILADYGVPLVQCSDCVVAGDLPSHGAYDKAITKKYEDRYLKSAAAVPATEAASADQIVTQKRLEEWLAAGADINAELNNAVMAFDPVRTKFLLGKGANVNKINDQGYAPLHTAARSRNSDLVTLLLEHGADPNLPDSDGMSPLVHAVMRNHVPSIEALAAKGADLQRENRQGYTPLEIAIGEDQLFAAGALIKAGAKVGTANGKQKITPLMLVASQLSAQARATHLAGGPTPVDIAEQLIDHGAEIDAKSAAGVTALMVAAGHNNAPMIGLLLGKGANPAFKNNLGKTALDVAREAHNDVAISALQLLSVPVPN